MSPHLFQQSPDEAPPRIADLFQRTWLSFLHEMVERYEVPVERLFWMRRWRDIDPRSDQRSWEDRPEEVVRAAWSAERPLVTSIDEEPLRSYVEADPTLLHVSDALLYEMGEAVVADFTPLETVMSNLRRWTENAVLNAWRSRFNQPAQAVVEVRPRTIELQGWLPQNLPVPDADPLDA